MELLPASVVSKGFRVKDQMDYMEVNELYWHGKDAIKDAISATTPKDRPCKLLARLTFGTVLKYMQAKNRSA